MLRNGLLAILLICLLNSCQQDVTDNTSPSDVGAMDLSGYETEELPNGVLRALRKDNNGLVKEEGYIVNGKKSGIWTTYIEDRAESITSYVGGILNGKTFMFDHRRQIIEEKTYVDGKLHGKQGTYKFGRPKLEEYYVRDTRHGPYRKYFESGKDQGKISQSVDYVNGKIDGKVRHFNGDGEVTVEYNYKNGEKISGGIVE